MKRFLGLLFAFVASGALAQSSPNLVFGQVPTAAQWNSYFAGKIDYTAGGLPISLGGTGATNAATARLNLGISSPADLATALPSAAVNKLYGGSGSAGQASIVSIGTGLTLLGGVLASTASGTGTVTNFSFTAGNGFTGSVANPTSTPALTVGTNVTGILKGNGTAMSAAVGNDLPVMTSTTRGAVPTPPNNTTTFLRGDGTFATIPAGAGGTVTNTSVVTANGFTGSVANPTSTPAITIATNVSGVLKGTGTAMVPAINSDLPAMSATVGGAVPTPPNSIVQFLRGDGTWATPAGGGSVTSVSVATANGFSGTVATASTTPVVSVSSPLVGMLKGTGAGIAVATAGTDYSAGTSSLGTGVVKSTSGTLGIATGNDLPVMTATTRGAVTTPPNDVSLVLRGDATWGVAGSGIAGLSASGDTLTYQKTPGGATQVSLVVQNDNPGMSSAVNPVSGSAGSPLNYAQININGSYVYPAASANSGFGGFLNFITRNLSGTQIQSAFLNGGLIGTTAGSERGDLDLGIYGHDPSGVGPSVPRVIGLRAENTGRLVLAVDADNQWDIGDTTTRWGNGWFRGQVSAGSFQGSVPIASLNNGTGASSSTFWRGDGTWAAVPTVSTGANNTWTGFQTFNGPYTDVTYPPGASASASKFTRTAPSGGGGTIGTAVFVGTTTVAGTSSFEWNQLNVLNNNATGGENVSFYAQAYKNSTGSTWAGVFEARDKTHVANPTGSLYGLEVDVAANGTDSNATRFGIQIVGYREDTGFAQNTVTNGIWIGAAVSDPSGTIFTNGINVAANGYIGLALSGNYSGTAISVSSSTFLPAVIDLSGASNVGSIFHISSFNPVYTSSALGAYVGKVKINIDGFTYYMPIYQ